MNVVELNYEHAVSANEANVPSHVFREDRRLVQFNSKTLIKCTPDRFGPGLDPVIVMLRSASI